MQKEATDNQNPHDPENTYNEHKKIENGEGTPIITSVRGWCGWVLVTRK